MNTNDSTKGAKTKKKEGNSERKRMRTANCKMKREVAIHCLQSTPIIPNPPHTVKPDPSTRPNAFLAS